jgi:hypothetical protein
LQCLLGSGLGVEILANATPFDALFNPALQILSSMARRHSWPSVGTMIDGVMSTYEFVLKMVGFPVFV